jgi:N6-adenosine-specific RNA methylase IME4
VKRYRTIVADPPWPIQWTGGSRKAGVSSGSTRTHEKKPLPYRTMSLEELRELGEFIRWKADDDAHLFMWTLDRFLLNGWATSVMRAWGFEPLPQMVVWNKANPGLGRHLRPAHELIVIGRRGNARFHNAAEPTVQTWRQPYEGGAKKHSAKPDGALDMIENLSPGPYLELFARRARFGWDYYGDESLGTATMAASEASGKEKDNPNPRRHAATSSGVHGDLEGEAGC